MNTIHRNKKQSESGPEFHWSNLMQLPLKPRSNAITMKKILSAIVAYATFIVAQAQQIDQVYIAPTNPTTADAVQLHIEGYLFSTDVFIANISVSQSGNDFIVQMAMQNSGGVGLPVLVPFDTTLDLGFLTAGNYSATVTAMLNGMPPGGSGQTAWEVSEVVGMVNPEALGFIMWPNPVYDQLHLCLLANEQPTKGLTISTLDGRVAHRQKLDAIPFATLFIDLSPGLYIVQLDGQKGSARLLVE